MEQDAGLTYEQLNAWMDASRDGNIDRVRDLVENEGSDDKYTDNGVVNYLGVPVIEDVNKADEDGLTPVSLAASRGDLEQVEYLVRKGADINAADNSGVTAFSYASGGGHLHVVEYLLGLGAAIDAVDSWGMTALMYASGRGHLSLVKYLVNKGANIHTAEYTDGFTALDKALKNNHHDIVKLLLHYCSPDSILKSSRKHPNLMYKALSDLTPEKCESASIHNSHLVREGEKRYRGCDYDITSSDINDVHYRSRLHLGSDAESLYNSHSFRMGVWGKTSLDQIPDYEVTEFKIPLNQPTDIKMLEAYLFVSMSQSNPKLFNKDTVIGDIVEAAWLEYGQFNHLILTALYGIYLVLTTILNYKFHDWILSNDYFKPLSLTLIAIIFLFSLFFMYLEFHEPNHRVDTSTNKIKTSNWTAFQLFHIFQYNMFDESIVFHRVAYVLVCIGSVVRFISQSESDESASIMAIGSALLWLKLMHFLRPLESGPLVRMIFVITFKIKWLLLIIIIVVLSFSQALFLLSNDSKGVELSDPNAGLVQSFFTMIGDVDVSQLPHTSNHKLAQFLLVVFIIASTILILNLLIAMMNSAYTKIADNALAEWNRERASIITQQWYFYTPEIKKYQFYLSRDNDVTMQAEAKEHRSVNMKIIKDEVSILKDDVKASNVIILSAIALSEEKIVNSFESFEERIVGVVNGMQRELIELRASNQALEASNTSLVKRVEALLLLYKQ